MHSDRFHISSKRRISPRTARIGLLVLGFILLLDILSVRFSTEIQATLTTPQIKIKLAVPTQLVNHPTRVASVAAVSQPTSTGTSTLPVKNILAQDTFQRPDQVFWGISSDGQPWGADAKNVPNFAIVNHAGQVTNGNGVY